MASVWREIRAAITDNVFWLIVVTGILGFAGQSAWTIPLLAVLLTVWSCISGQEWSGEFGGINDRPELVRTFWDVQYWSTDFAQTLEHSHASAMRIAKQLAEAKACERI